MHKLVPLVMSILTTLSISHAAVFTVSNAKDTGRGSLRWCLSESASGDEIRFAPHLDGTPILLGHPVGIRHALTVTGRGPENTILDGGHDRTVIFIFGDAGSITLSNLTVRNGKVNPLSKGGAIIVGSGDVTMNSVVVSGSQAWDGAGIAQYGGTLTLNDTELRGNTAGHDGGGIWSRGGLVLNRSTVSGNAAYRGGAIFLDHASVTLNHSTISGNTATNTGGGIRGDYSFIRLNSSTVVGNSGLAAGGIHTGNRYASLHNSIVANQLAGRDCASFFSRQISRGHNLDSDGTCDLDRLTDLPDTDPMLGPLSYNGGWTWTHVPLEASPVIDRGTCLAVTDQRGAPQPLDGDGDSVMLCDIGAVEYVPYPVQAIGPGGEIVWFEPDGD